MDIDRNGSFRTETRTASEIINKIVKGQYIIPPFQRLYVWINKDIENLVNSIVHLFPIGQILIWEENNGETFNIIDGQQRITSLYLIMSNPFKYLNDDLFLSINDDLRDVEKHLFKDFYKKILKEIKKINIFENSNLFIELTKIEKFNKLISNNNNEVKDYFEEKLEKIIISMIKNENKWSISNKIKNNIFEKYLRKISTLNIPITFLSNFKEEQIMEIFKRLNTKGVPLTTFEIFAASWSKHKININDSKILKPIDEQRKENNKYFLDNNIDLDNFNNKNLVRKNKGYIPSELYYSLIFNSIKDTIFFSKRYLSPNNKSEHKIKNEIILETKQDIFLSFIYEFLVCENYLEHGDEKKRYEKIGEALKKWYEDNENKIKDKINNKLARPWKIMEEKIKILTKNIKNSKDWFLFDKIFKSENIYISTATQILISFYKNDIDDSYKNLNSNVWYYSLKNEFSSSTSQTLKENNETLKYLIEEKKLDEFKKIINDYSIEIDRINNLNNVPSNLKKTISEAIVNISLFSFDITKKYKTKKLFGRSLLEKLNLNTYYHSIGNNTFINKDVAVLFKNKINSLYEKLINYDILTVTINENKEKYEEYFSLIKDEENLSNKEQIKKFLKLREEIMVDIFLKQIL